MVIVLSSAVAAAPMPALASGFQLIEQNGSGLGNAYAGQAAGVTDASAIYYNPAALTRIEKRQFVHLRQPHRRLDGVRRHRLDAALPADPPPLTLPVSAGGSGGDAGGWIPVPNAYFSCQVSPRFWAGLGVNAPFGLKTEWDADWQGRFHAIKSEVKTLNINPTLAVKATDWLSFGAGASYQRLEAELTQNVAYGGIAVGAAAAAAGPAAAAGILAQLGGPAGLAREGQGSVERRRLELGLERGRAGAHRRSRPFRSELPLEGQARHPGER